MSGTLYYVVSDEEQLNAAIAAIDQASVTAPANSAATIEVANDFILNSDIAAVVLASGTSLLITGNSPSGGNTSAQIDGGDRFRGFTALSGALTLDNLGLQNMQAVGGIGSDGTKAGGGGAGLGAAVFVGAAASVLLSSVSFTADSAVGGNGGVTTRPGSGAGGTGVPGGFGTGGPGGLPGGFGGGGGGSASGGFGAGSGSVTGGGGGLAAGGDIFVQQGGLLDFATGSAGAGSLTPGGPGGHAFGSGIFIQGTTTVTLGAVAITGVIADQTGSGGTGANAGAGSILAQGAVTLAAKNTYTGGTEITGSLTLLAVGAAGTGEITFGAGQLVIGAGDAPANLIGGFVTGDMIDLQGIGLATSFTLSAGNVLSVLGGFGGPVALHLDPAQNYAGDVFVLQPDGAKGTSIAVTQSHFDVSSEASLDAALSGIAIGGQYAAPGVAYTISLTADITLGSDLYAVNIAKGEMLTIDGAGHTIDGGNAYRGLFAYAGKLGIQNLTIQDTVASGGAGGVGVTPGGGGAGLGGALFVGAAASVTLTNVDLRASAAAGGNAGAAGGTAYGGGGGLGGTGGMGASRAGGGGGVGVGNTADGGTFGGPGNGGPGILVGAADASAGTGTYVSVGYSPGAGGADGGGGGMAGVFSGSGRGGRSHPGSAGSGGVWSAASFGGGAGSGQVAGFGGGGAFSGSIVPPNAGSNAGGWGGGGSDGAGGFGGGSGGTGAAGGGLGAGGNVFVQQGGTLTIAGGVLAGGSVSGGLGNGGVGNGAAYGSGIFFQGNNKLTLSPDVGQVLAIGGGIADQKGSANVAGAASLVMNGTGTLLLSAASTYTGGTTINSGTVSLQAAGAAGKGRINFGYGASATLVIGSNDLPANVIGLFLPGETIDLQGIGTATSATLGAGAALSVSGGLIPVKLALDSGQIFTGETFAVASDGAGGTLLTAVTVNNDRPALISGAASNGTDHAAFAPLKGVTISAADPQRVQAVKLTVASAKNGTLATPGGGSYDALTGIYSVSGTAAAVTAAIDALVFTPIIHQVAPGRTVPTKFTLAVTDGTMAAATSFNVYVSSLNDPPAITGSGAQLDAYWDVPIAAFGGVSIVDPDAGAAETVTITLANSGSPGFATDANGTLALAAPVQGVALSHTGAGTYVLSSANPAAVTAALDAIAFTPVSSNPSAGFTLTYLSLSVSDGIAPAVTGQAIVVSAGLPIITGAVAGQAVPDTVAIAPFASVQITDSAYFTQESVTIILTDATGSATDANGALSGSGLSEVAGGTYALASGTPAGVTAALDALVFTPTAHQVAAGQSVATNFELSVFNGATTHNDYGTSVIATASALPVASITAASIGGSGGITFLPLNAPAIASAAAAHQAVSDPALAAKSVSSAGFQDLSQHALWRPRSGLSEAGTAGGQAHRLEIVAGQEWPVLHTASSVW